MAPRSAGFDPVKPDVQIPAQEQKVLDGWDRDGIFQKTLDATKPLKPYSFYDGPPFATGLPHYGHLLAGILKDIVPRYWTMRGYHIPRRFGWDCHGLPVEYEINKKLKIDSSKQVYAMGVDKYNAECRSIVQRYSEEWKATVRRIGRWVDMEKPYFTMDTSFMESVWWVFSQLWEKGLIYEGYKVVPYSVGVSTPLSNFEAGQNYKDVQDPAITVTFPVKEKPGVSFLAWTTTPWTLPSNLGLAVGEDLHYVQVKDVRTGHQYILAEALLASYWKKPTEELEVIADFKGRDLVGLTYEPLFQYFAGLRAKKAFQVILAEHVTTESGTGIVHMAPAFGEEDYVACQKAGLPIVNPVDDDGMFTAEVPDYAGRRVKEADKDIIARLKAEGRLLKQDTITHSYPFCPRSDTPLIYRAVSTWFVRVEQIKERILKANAGTAWVPDHLRDGRFGNWLENARDWAVSRNRFWGTPLPIWSNPQGERVCIGSIAELEKLSGVKVSDLHIDVVGKITIPSKKGGAPLKQTGGVLDCWFESGSMPYAQWGYPQTHKTDFEKNFPAEFIAEGLDQTRGWFYTLMVIGTALFDKAPFRHVVVNGLILAEDGKKMSKSLRNYPDPMGVLNQHGADALRLYLIDSPVVKAQELRFSEKGVKDVVRKILLRWWNSYSFFVNYANVDGFRPKGDYHKSKNILDLWVLSRLNSLVKNTNQEMEGYRLYNVVPGLLQFIEELTNTYIRFNRRHFWQEGMPEDKRLAYETLHHVLVTLSKVMAPFTPFMAEVIYENLSRGLGGSKSVHLESYPMAEGGLIHPDLESAVARMEQLVLMARNIREKISVRGKVPLNWMRVIHREKHVLDELKKLESYFVDELNIREVRYETDEDKYVQISTKADFKKLGPKLGPKMKEVAAGIAKLSLKEILALESGKSLEVAGFKATLEDVEIRRAPKTPSDTFSTHQLISIELDPTVTPEQVREGLSREVLRKVQQARKGADLKLDDRIKVEIKCGAELRDAVEAHRAYVMGECLALDLKFVDADPRGEHVEAGDVDGDPVSVGITRA
ncbi:MAG TPA: isoleucine--tRNA ligase [Bdellovibrionota bacterium]|nr:isoleucine--tRNA ligase [Bdellovibrionota bacterium]